jgi:hypothetical protein
VTASGLTWCDVSLSLQFFNAHTFKLEEKCYQDERIKFDHVHYIDNQPVLDLIENKPNGILPSIDVRKGSLQTRCAVIRSSVLACSFFLVFASAGGASYAEGKRQDLGREDDPDAPIERELRAGSWIGVMLHRQALVRRQTAQSTWASYDALLTRVSVAVLYRSVLVP